MPEARGRKHRWPWREMEVGDSFFVPTELEMRELHLRDTARFAKIRIAQRVVVENGIRGVRVWRIEDESPKPVAAKSGGMLKTLSNLNGG